MDGDNGSAIFLQFLQGLKISKPTLYAVFIAFLHSLRLWHIG